MKINATKLIANTSAILALGAVALESGKMGVKKAHQNYQLQGAKDTIQDTVGLSKLNYPSPVYNETKKEIFKLKNPHPVKDIVNGVVGYFKGFAEGVLNHIPAVGFAIATLCFKSPKIKALGAIGVGVSTLCNFLINGTNIFEKKDYLE